MHLSISQCQASFSGRSSFVTAGGNINIVAKGADDDEHHSEHGSDDNDKCAGTSKRSNITLQGSNIKAGKDTTLAATNDINLLAAKNTAEQHSTNSSSSGSIGVGVSLNSKGAGLMATASASAARGNADGSDVTWTNAHVDAGNTLTIKSGNNTNMKGAVASGKQVVADIGGNLNIESLQDTSTYGSQQTSRGGSLSVAIIGTGSGGSVNAADTNINSNYASVIEQSGIKAGDGGYKVKVKGNTDLKGAVIAASDTGLEKSTFTTGGTLTQSDIQNSASYNAEAMAVSAGVGDKASASAGLGEDSGHASATTKSGIGVSTKTDTTGAIAKIFDANKVTEEVNAQVQITQTFSQLAPKAVADFSATRAKNLRQDAKNETDPLKKQSLLDDAAKWDEGGIYRIALHTVSGALSGGVNGATGALTTASAAPLLDEMQANVQTALINQGMSEEKAKLVAQGVAEVTSAGMGYASGGLQGVATGLTVDTNNRQLHPPETKRIAELANGDPDKEARLTEAACALVHCSAEYPADSQERRYYEGVELRGQADTYAIQQLENAQKSDPTLFSYDWVDHGIDLSKKVGNTFIQTGDKLVDLGTGAAKGAGKTIVQIGALALDAAQLAGAGASGDGGENIDPYSDLGKAIQKDGVVETVGNIPGNTLRGIADAVHSAGQGDFEPLGEVAGGVAVPVVAGKIMGGATKIAESTSAGESGASLSMSENFGTGPLRNPAIPPKNPSEGILIDSTQGLQSRTNGTFDNVSVGVVNDAKTRYLWTVDERGVNLAPEQTAVGENSIIKHTNISSQASIGGQAWFGTGNTVTIDPFSGRFGTGAGVTDTQWANTITTWESLGYKVNTVPYKK